LFDLTIYFWCLKWVWSLYYWWYTIQHESSSVSLHLHKYILSPYKILIIWIQGRMRRGMVI